MVCGHGPSVIFLALAHQVPRELLSGSPDQRDQRVAHTVHTRVHTVSVFRAAPADILCSTLYCPPSELLGPGLHAKQSPTSLMYASPNKHADRYGEGNQALHTPQFQTIQQYAHLHCFTCKEKTYEPSPAVGASVTDI